MGGVWPRLEKGSVAYKRLENPSKHTSSRTLGRGGLLSQGHRACGRLSGACVNERRGGVTGCVHLHSGHRREDSPCGSVGPGWTARLRLRLGRAASWWALEGGNGSSRVGELTIAQSGYQFKIHAWGLLPRGRNSSGPICVVPQPGGPQFGRTSFTRVSVPARILFWSFSQSLGNQKTPAHGSVFLCVKRLSGRAAVCLCALELQGCAQGFVAKSDDRMQGKAGWFF